MYPVYILGKAFTAWERLMTPRAKAGELVLDRVSPLAAL